jgi:hypothetical protein
MDPLTKGLTIMEPEQWVVMAVRPVAEIKDFK